MHYLHQYITGNNVISYYGGLYFNGNTVGESKGLILKKLYVAIPGSNNYIIWFFIDDIAVTIIKIKL